MTNDLACLALQAFLICRQDFEAPSAGQVQIKKGTTSMLSEFNEPKRLLGQICGNWCGSQSSAELSLQASPDEAVVVDDSSEQQRGPRTSA